MTYVIGVDLGTSAVKVLLVNKDGEVLKTVSKTYPIIQSKPGYSEQDPDEWVKQTKEALKELFNTTTIDREAIEGLSFSGQMHGLVLLNEADDVLRPAILWNDTRTTEQCERINDTIGETKLLEITKNKALEGFTLPKLMWVKENEPHLYKEIQTFLLPKDYVRFRITGQKHIDYSDAAGTLMFDIEKQVFSKEILGKLDINMNICPEPIASHEEISIIDTSFIEETGLPRNIRIFAGGADNACGAIGAGIVQKDKTMCSIGTSGVVLSYEDEANKDYSGKVHYFNHGVPNKYYTMGVTLSAGSSLTWFKDRFLPEESFESLLVHLDQIKPGANGLLFTPYLFGERTPHADSNIRASFIGLDNSHTTEHLIRALIEGITFSLNETIEMFRSSGKKINEIVSIGGGAKNDTWLQIQANIFNAEVIKLSTEQGPGMGAAMIAAYGCDWFTTIENCAKVFIKEEKRFIPDKKTVALYQDLFNIYQKVYTQTKLLNDYLIDYR